jgi:hypothetical protein
MRPSHPGYAGGGAPTAYLGGRGAGLPAHRLGGGNTHHQHNNLKYYPSLSGSETDVSTSTENLTQVRSEASFQFKQNLSRFINLH